MKKKVLGRGLGALIPEVEGTAAGSSAEIDIDRIVPNPDQPRMKLDEQTLEQLSVSIREHGVLQPILVRPFGQGYQLVAGERRWSAAQRAGLLRIPAVVKNIPDDRLLELALIENIQREQLNPIEEAQAYQHLIEELGATQEALAARLGKERSTIANSLRLLKLPAQVKILVAEGKLSPGHARALLASTASPAEMIRIAATMVERGWSVRDAENWARNLGREKKGPRIPDPNEVAASDQLRILFGTKVEILTGGKSKGAGHIRIHFYNQEDLVRIYSLLTDKR
jgi:ParB family transcriptional regulator, chromosome partitioning protein